MIKFGAYVKTSGNNYSGRVTGIRFMDKNDQEWLDLQTIRPTREQLDGPWVSVLCEPAGAVEIPLDTVTVVDEFEFTNPWNEEQFGGKQLTL